MGCLGTASAEALHDAAHRVIVTHSPGRAEVQAWLDAHAAKGCRFLSYAMDVADAASCAACAERVSGDRHVVAILINNAGITRDLSFRTIRVTTRLDGQGRGSTVIYQWSPSIIQLKTNPNR